MSPNGIVPLGGTPGWDPRGSPPPLGHVNKSGSEPISPSVKASVA